MADAEAKIRLLFSSFDVDEGNSLDYDEIKNGMATLPFAPPIRLTKKDFLDITDGGRLCHTRPMNLTCEEFIDVIMTQARTLPPPPYCCPYPPPYRTHPLCSSSMSSSRRPAPPLIGKSSCPSDPPSP